jgi:pyridoxamine 5'-phosphate oxidase
MNLNEIRTDYSGKSIVDLPPEPHRGMELWLSEALNAEVEATAFSLATCDKAAGPSVRIVLAKSISVEGVVFYSNGNSEKGRDMAENARAAGVFFWPNLQRQLRFEGAITRVAAPEADAYFSSRPRASQIAAHISAQSQPIASYEELIQKFDHEQVRLDGRDVERPPAWGGFLVSLQKVEFWQGQRSRLHQRLVYERQENGTYVRGWLQP